MDELLPVGYYHIVFTLPHQLNVFCMQNKKLMYDILFKAASETVLELVADPMYFLNNSIMICFIARYQLIPCAIHLYL